MEIDKQKKDLKRLGYYLSEINRSSPTRNVTIGHIETNATINSEREECEDFFVHSWPNDKEALKVFNELGLDENQFKIYNNFDWYRLRWMFLTDK